MLCVCIRESISVISTLWPPHTLFSQIGRGVSPKIRSFSKMKGILLDQGMTLQWHRITTADLGMLWYQKSLKWITISVPCEALTRPSNEMWTVTIILEACKMLQIKTHVLKIIHYLITKVRLFSKVERRLFSFLRLSFPNI